MIDRIKEMLERGERVALKCVDRDGFLYADCGEFFDENSIILSTPLVVEGVVDYCDAVSIKGCSYVISFDELEYFKIKEPEYTFNDLIDVAVQAVKDGVIDIKTLCMDSIRFTPIYDIDNVATYFYNEYADGFDYIKSLYTETFVIESESDIKKTKEGASVELANGNVFIVNKSKHESLAMKDGSKATGLTFKDSNNFWITYSLFELKGATVTQEVSK